MEKRGQVTTIIIIGVLAIIAVVSVYTIRTYILKAEFETQYEKHIKVPVQIDPVRKYMDECLTSIAQDGIDLLGVQGGYLNLPPDNLPRTPVTPFGNSLEIFPNSDYRTSFWFRETSNGIKVTNVPQINDMETDLGDYINNNIGFCINNLTAFSDQGYVFEISQAPSSSVEIIDRTVNIRLDYPIHINYKDLDFDLESSFAKINSNLGLFHKLALQIMESENKNLFLEQQTIDYLAVYDEIPFSGVDLTCVDKVWSKTNTINKIKEVVSKNIPAVKIKGTSYTLPNADHKYFEFNAISGSYPEVQASMMYSTSWPMYVDITPSDGDVLRGSQISRSTGNLATNVLSSFTCLSVHHFVYDIKYPVLIMLADKDGFIYQFATEVIIDNNEPRQNLIQPLEIPEPAIPICKYATKELTVRTLTPEKDGTLVPLNGADVYLKCFPSTCGIGSTKLDRNGDSSLAGKFPPCLNGVIEARKEGYQPAKETVSTNEEESPSVNLILEPYYENEVSLKLIDSGRGDIRDPYESEEISFGFYNNDTGYSTTYLYPSNETLKLSVGNYRITSFVIGSSTWPITFPARTITKCVDVQKAGILSLIGVSQKKEQCFDIKTDKIEADTVVKGGAMFDYTFTRDQLAKGELTLYTMVNPIPSTMEELSATYSKLETNKFDPRFRYPE